MAPNLSCTPLTRLHAEWRLCPGEHFDDIYFYGLSPPVYSSGKNLLLHRRSVTDFIPAPMSGQGGWATAYSKAVALVSQMTFNEKANIIVGYTPDSGCSGVTGSVPRIDWPGLCLSDAGNGLRATDLVNSWPSGFHVGASWNCNLAYQRALYMGAEFKTKSVNVASGPVVGPLGRVDVGGRNWECISNDRKLRILGIGHGSSLSSISWRST
jgi:beta-glucosidase